VKVESVTIVTPCRNAGSLIGRTVDSIMGQSAVRSGRVRLQYLVCDGASTDGTLEVVRQIAGSAAEIVSEPDRGMYDALAKGLRRATGDVVAYLNAGDLYAPTALDVVADVFEQNDVSWITGYQVEYNEKGQFISSLLPYRYRRRLIRSGLYGVRRILTHHIQQESTFWARGLVETLDFDALARCRLAGDYYLWTCFAGQADLRVVQSYLGGFAYHPGQQSQAIDAYNREARALACRPGAADLALAAFDGAAWLLPILKGRVHHRDVIRYSLTDRRWVSSP
jgi:glycosyltransferase involved in cell wall biosynthesis